MNPQRIKVMEFEHSTEHRELVRLRQMRHSLVSTAYVQRTAGSRIPVERGLFAMAK